MRTEKQQAGHVEIHAATWIRDNEVHTHFSLNTNSLTASIWTPLSINETEALIELLHRHITNIKDNEMELIALNTKSAA